MRLTHCAFPFAAVALAACGAASDSESTRDDAAEVSIDTNAAYPIVGVHSGECIEVAGGSTSSLAQIQIATCNTDNRQQFRLDSIAGSYYRIRNVKSGLCAAVSDASMADGAKVVQDTCGAGFNHSGPSRMTNQQFKLRVVSTPDAGAGEGGGGVRSAGCGKPSSLARGNYTIDVNGASREYILDVPPNYDPNRAYRLVFGWHWRGGQASDVAATTGYYGMKALAKGSAIFVAPQRARSRLGQ